MVNLKALFYITVNRTYLNNIIVCEGLLPLSSVPFSSKNQQLYNSWLKCVEQPLNVFNYDHESLLKKSTSDNFS